VLAAEIPLRVQSASRVISASADLTGYLPLSQDTVATSAFVRALEPRRSMLWMLQDGYPIWGGVIWDTPHQDVLTNQLPIRASTPESLIAKRLIPSAGTFTGDVYDILRALFAYATGQLIPQFPSTIGRNAQIAGLSMQQASSGITDTLTLGVSNVLVVGGDVYAGSYSNWQNILSAAQALASADEVEFTFEPSMDENGNLGFLLRFGTPGLGRYDNPGWHLVHPGNVRTYGHPVMGSQAANQVITTSSANGSGKTYTSASPHGIDTADLDDGYPLLQAATTWPGVGVTSQAQADAYADWLLAGYTAGTAVPSPVVGPGQQPTARDVSLGDAVYFAATSSLHPADPVTGAPGLQLTARISGWTLIPPEEGQDESFTPTLGALVGDVTAGGVS
jgi:hypothetical protein